MNNTWYGSTSMTSSSSTTTNSSSIIIDVDAMEEEEEEEAQPNGASNRRHIFQNSLPSYQPVITSVNNNDDDDAGAESASSTTPTGLTTEEATRRTPYCSHIYKASILLVALIFIFLLAADVFQRFGWSSPVFSLALTPRQPQQPQERWVPTADILHESGIPELKFIGDKNMGGLQGLALDPRNSTVLYEFHTLGVRVLQLSPRTDLIQVVGLEKSRAYNGTADFPLILQHPVAHIGGIDVAYSQTHGTEIWIATHAAEDGEGALWAIDPMTLNVKGDHRAVRVDYMNLDWVAYRDGILYFGSFFNVKSIKRVALDTLEPLDDLVVVVDDDDGLNYIQSAAFDQMGRLVLLGDDYQCTIYILDPLTGVLLGSQGLLLGSETDGLTFDMNRRGQGASSIMLAGFNRDHSHEQVMGQEPMISVIQLDLV